MRKSLLYMIGKNTPCILLTLLLIVSITPSASALPTGTYLSLDPMVIPPPDVLPGESFTIDVNVTNVASLQGPEFKLWYNTTVLNVTGVTLGDVTPNPIVKGPVGPAPGYYWSPYNFTTPFNAYEKGCVWVVLLNPLGQAFTGNGTIATVHFIAKAIGSSTLHLNETTLGNPSGLPITHTFWPAPPDPQGTVEVVPEFPAIIAMTLLLIATLAATIIGKMVWSKKRKDALIAK